MKRTIPRLILLALLLPGCEAKIPLIAPIVPQWEENVPTSTVQIVKTLGAVITNRPDVSTLKVFVRFSRHEWVPGEGNAFMGEAVRSTGPNPDLYEFALTDAATFLNTQAVFFQWFVVDRPAGGSETVLAESPVQQFRIGCPGARTADVLKADQQSVLSTFDNAPRFPPPGYILPHRTVSFRGNGVAAATVQVISPGHTATLGSPDLLFDAQGGPPFRLIGWAYTFPFDMANRPRWNCIPYEAWFVHAGGWHTSDGMFEVQPNPGVLPTTGSSALPAPPPFWHAPVWDLHVWRRDGQVPLLEIGDTSVAQGSSDVAFPPGAFFRPAVTPFP
jgi:hypothetical protein